MKTEFESDPNKPSWEPASSPDDIPYDPYGELGGGSGGGPLGAADDVPPAGWPPIATDATQQPRRLQRRQARPSQTPSAKPGLDRVPAPYREALKYQDNDGGWYLQADSAAAAAAAIISLGVKNGVNISEAPMDTCNLYCPLRTTSTIASQRCRPDSPLKQVGFGGGGRFLSWNSGPKMRKLPSTVSEGFRLTAATVAAATAQNVLDFPASDAIQESADSCTLVSTPSSRVIFAAPSAPDLVERLMSHWGIGRSSLSAGS
ncbi:hypothetical protein DFJ77DRAFT_512903 [Powellomyces hirtus]|nr:hypothetical protein DFJ77DRAFT_512903 [Powellomyces hirtus]